MDAYIFIITRVHTFEEFFFFLKELDITETEGEHVQEYAITKKSMFYMHFKAWLEGLFKYLKQCGLVFKCL